MTRFPLNRCYKNTFYSEQTVIREMEGHDPLVSLALCKERISLLGGELLCRLAMAGPSLLSSATQMTSIKRTML